MKQAVYDKKGRMFVTTGHQQFNRQTNRIATGNIIANTQHSWYIRSAQETSCNGKHDYAVGELRDFDLKHYTIPLPSRVVDWVKKETQDKQVILYTFFHTQQSGKKTIHGWVVTDENHNHIVTLYGSGSYKSSLVLNECRKYICNDEE